MFWLNTTVGVTTGSKGEFEISSKNGPEKKLLASFVGYSPDTIEVANEIFVAFSLKKEAALEEVTISAKKPGVIISDLKPMKTEQITQSELRKAACCDLAGCFETQTTVQPQTTNVVTNSKELRILALSGVYNQVLIDGLPMIQGLSYKE